MTKHQPKKVTFISYLTSAKLPVLKFDVSA